MPPRPPRRTLALLTCTALAWSLLPPPVQAQEPLSATAQARYPVVQPIADSSLVLERAGGMDVAADGTAYLLDAAAEAVYAVTPDGDHTLALDREDLTDVPRSWEPMDVAVTDDGTLFVASADELTAVSPDGDTEPVFTGPGTNTDDVPDHSAFVAAEGDTVYFGFSDGRLWTMEADSEPEQLLTTSDLPDLGPIHPAVRADEDAPVNDIAVDDGTLYLATHTGLLSTDATETGGPVETELDSEWLREAAFATDDRTARGVAVHDGTAAVVTGTGITLTDLEAPARRLLQPVSDTPEVAIDHDGRILVTSNYGRFPGSEALWELTSTDTADPWPEPAEPEASPSTEGEPRTPGSVTQIPTDRLEAITVDTDGELHGAVFFELFSATEEVAPHEALTPVPHMWASLPAESLAAGGDGSVLFAQQLWAHRVFPDGSVQTIPVDEPGKNDLDRDESYWEHGIQRTALGPDGLYAAQGGTVLALSPEHDAEEIYSVPDDNVRVTGLAAGYDGSLFISEYNSQDEQGRLLRLHADGSEESLLDNTDVTEDGFHPGALAVDNEDTVYVRAATGRKEAVLRVTDNGAARTIALFDSASSSVESNSDLVLDGDGNLRATNVSVLWTVHDAANAPAQESLPRWTLRTGGLVVLALLGALFYRWRRRAPAAHPGGQTSNHGARWVARIPEDATPLVGPAIRSFLGVLGTLAVVAVALGLWATADTQVGGIDWIPVQALLAVALLVLTGFTLLIWRRGGPLLATTENGLWVRAQVLSPQALYLPWSAIATVRAHKAAAAVVVILEDTASIPTPGPWLNSLDTYNGWQNSTVTFPCHDIPGTAESAVAVIQPPTTNQADPQREDEAGEPTEEPITEADQKNNQQTPGNN